MRHILLTAFLATFLAAVSFGQTPQSQDILIKPLEKLPNADAVGAVEITDSIFGPVNVSAGFGSKQELKENGDNIIEHNSAWFKFTMRYDTSLTFDIVPIDSLDDYDFTLYKCANGDCEGKSGVKYLRLVRQCYSVCYSKSGMTGISRYTGAMKVGPGDGPAYVCSLPVKAGETYYLAVDIDTEMRWRHRSIDENPKAEGKAPAGFTIYFYNYCPKRKPIVLNNIFFETNKSTLKSESFKELDSLVVRLKNSPMVIEISGHTDNVGSEAKNRILSEARALAVKDYLVSKNIDQRRIYCKGYGGSKPIADNKSEEGRGKNRRVEFVILLN